MAPDHRRAPPLPAGVPGLAPPSRPLHRPSAASYGMSHPPPLRATPPPLPPPQPLPRSQETFRGDHRSLGGDLSTLGGDPRLSLPAPARRGRTSCAVPAPREANSTPGPHQLCCAGPTGTPARQGRTSCAVQAPQEPPHARAAPAVLCRPHRNPRTPGPHQQCCAGPTGTPARQGRTSCAVQAPQEPPHARAAPAVLCRPHSNPRTPGPHQLCCAGPTRNPARQGRTSCAVQAPQETGSAPPLLHCLTLFSVRVLRGASWVYDRSICDGGRAVECLHIAAVLMATPEQIVLVMVGYWGGSKLGFGMAKYGTTTVSQRMPWHLKVRSHSPGCHF